jgi:hypothetical protein
VNTLALPPLSAVRRRMLAALSVAAVLGVGVCALADWAADHLPRATPLGELAYYPSGRHVRPAALGHAEAAADLAWLRAVQYYGEHRQGDNRFDHLFHVFDILTTLAPRFENAYVFGAFSLAQEGRDFPRALVLMEKGIEANPRSGWLAFEMGFLHYVRPGGRDLGAAARWFEQAARLPGAPPNAARFAAFARQHAGDLGLARALWQQVLTTSANPMLQDIARREISRIEEAIATGRREAVVRRLSTPQVLLVDK